MPQLLLESSHIVETIRRLGQRIEARFPGSGLARICGDLLAISQSAAERAAAFGRPIVALRVFSGLLVALLVAGLGLAVAATGLRWGTLELKEVIQLSEAGLNEAIVIGAGLLFLIGFERRIKRGRGLRALHELRSVAHVIDMHQLTKDPERLLDRYFSTSASPQATMTAFELNRYLGYCSELLSLTGKVAAIYVQKFDDPVVLEAVGEIEDLTTGLCQKIWQKMSLLQRISTGRASGESQTAAGTDVPPHLRGGHP